MVSRSSIAWFLLTLTGAASLPASVRTCDDAAETVRVLSLERRWIEAYLHKEDVPPYRFVLPENVVPRRGLTLPDWFGRQVIAVLKQTTLRREARRVHREFWETFHERCHDALARLKKGSPAEETWMSLWQEYHLAVENVLAHHDRYAHRERLALHRARIDVAATCHGAIAPGKGTAALETLEHMRRTAHFDWLYFWSHSLSTEERSILLRTSDSFLQAFQADREGSTLPLWAGWERSLLGVGPRSQLARALLQDTAIRIFAALDELPEEVRLEVGAEKRRVALARQLDLRRGDVGWNPRFQAVLEGLYATSLISAVEKFEDTEASEEERAERFRSMVEEFEALSDPQVGEGLSLILTRQQISARWIRIKWRLAKWAPQSVLEQLRASFRRTGRGHRVLEVKEDPTLHDVQWWGESFKTAFKKPLKVRPQGLPGNLVEEMGGGRLPPGHYVASVSVQLEDDTTRTVRFQFMLEEENAGGEQVVNFPDHWVTGLIPIPKRYPTTDRGWWLRHEPLQVTEMIVALLAHVEDQTAGDAGKIPEVWKAFEELCTRPPLKRVAGPFLREEPADWARFVTILEEVQEGLRQDPVSASAPLSVDRQAWPELYNQVADVLRNQPTGSVFSLPAETLKHALFLGCGNPYQFSDKQAMSLAAGKSVVPGRKQNDSAPVVIRLMLHSGSS